MEIVHVEAGEDSNTLLQIPLRESCLKVFISLEQSMSTSSAKSMAADYYCSRSAAATRGQKLEIQLRAVHAYPVRVR